jgi:NAD(P)-dependent dehydrogenase (short-subunit alcohol dehydrogenase family)
VRVTTGFDPTLLTNRLALVTGAASGIGAATAEALAGVGAALALCDRDEHALAATVARIRSCHGARIHTAILDVRDADDVERFVFDAATTLGPIDILVNNVGGTFRADFRTTTPNGEDALIAENFRSVTQMTRAMLAHRRETGGAIVNITSIEAHRAAPGFAVYAAMKAAVASLTKSLALELAECGVRVNSVAPDAIPTPGTGGVAASTPLGRAGAERDVAAAVVFLASDLAGFVTGTTLHVDGGIHAAGGWRRNAGGRFET